MIVIHQAIYGELPGKTSGHDLLAASAEKKELFRRVSGYTDPVDRPKDAVLSGPVVRGFLAENHFLLIKTFSDISPGLRSGRVFSHVLFISKTDLHRINNLSDLFQFYLPGIQKEAEMHPLEYHSQAALPPTGAVDGKEAAATNALLQNDSFVWLGKQGYWDWMARIWPHLPFGVKHTLKIGAAFDPSNAKNEYINLLYIPEDAKALWERHSFRVIDAGAAETLQSAATHWLVGNTEEAAPFQVLIDDFSPKIESIEQLNQLQDYGKAYHQSGGDNYPELNHLLVLANFVSQVSPDERVGIKGKNRLMTAILKAIPSTPVEKFTSLIYQSWKGFPEANTSASDAVRNWLSNHLLQGKDAKKCCAVLVKALEAENKNWWTKTVLEYVTDRLNKRQRSDAPVLWQWIKNEPALIAQHSAWLPDDAENELIQYKPKLETAVAEAVLQMANQRGWLVLHAKVAAECYSANRAIEVQLRIDTDKDHTVALEALSESIKGSEFVSVAAGHTDPRLHQIAGKLIAGNSKHLKGINVASVGWQHCWEAAIEKGNEVWSGISNPQHTLFEILDHLLAGNSFSETLLNAMSNGKHSSLKDYPERSSIWSKLPEKARSWFIIATLLEVVDELASGQLQFNDLEAELKSGMQSQEAQHQIIGSETIPLTTKIRLFDVLPGLGVQHAKLLMQAKHLSQTEAERFGRLVSKMQWKAVADALFDQRNYRQDLVPALLRCSHLLGFWQRLSLSVSGMKSDVITLDEWWEELLSRAVELYPLGPTQNGLWLNAGGKLEELHHQGVSGKQSWSFAINHIRRGGSPTAKKLLNEMQKEFHRDSTLTQLIQSL